MCTGMIPSSQSLKQFLTMPLTATQLPLAPLRCKVRYKPPLLHSSMCTSASQQHPPSPQESNTGTIGLRSCYRMQVKHALGWSWNASLSLCCSQSATSSHTPAMTTLALFRCWSIQGHNSIPLHPNAYFSATETLTSGELSQRERGGAEQGHSASCW